MKNRNSRAGDSFPWLYKKSSHWDNCFLALHTFRNAVLTVDRVCSILPLTMLPLSMG
jgi:hypothetical protein